jgi:hypothetical protein
VWDVIEGADQCYRAERSPVDIAEKLYDAIKTGTRSDGRDRIGHLEISEVAKKVVGVYESVLNRN